MASIIVHHSIFSAQIYVVDSISGHVFILFVRISEIDTQYEDIKGKIQKPYFERKSDNTAVNRKRTIKRSIERGQYSGQ
jgi:hypothetical protein